jgi:regulatory protein
VLSALDVFDELPRRLHSGLELIQRCKTMPEHMSAGALQPESANGGAARAAAIALLSRRDFTSAELQQRLRSKGFQSQTARSVVATLISQGIVNDERYAQNYVAYHAGRGHGPIRIGADLRSRGIAPTLIDAALDAGPDWRAVARAARRRRFGERPPESWREKARQARFLQYRGFSADHIRAATGVNSEPD